jgi:hypothetical protein
MNASTSKPPGSAPQLLARCEYRAVSDLFGMLRGASVAGIA